MMQCGPQMPGGGINITVSIDLGAMLAGKPGPCPQPEDDDKLTYFNEANRPKKGGFSGAMDCVRSKYGGKSNEPEGTSDELSSSSYEKDPDKKEKSEEES